VYQQLCSGSEAPDKLSGQLTGYSEVIHVISVETVHVKYWNVV
jgi:hypothetical protein